MSCILDIFTRQDICARGISPSLIRTLLSPDIFAGCGSTGFAAANGVGRNYPGLPFFLDPDAYATSNGPRQMVGMGQFDANKAEANARNIISLIPTLPAIFDSTGVGPHFENQIRQIQACCDDINQRLASSDISPIRPIIFDSVDVTTKAGWKAKAITHFVAHKEGIPTIGAFDTGTMSQVFYFPYQDPNEPLLHGKITMADVDTHDPQALNMKLVKKLLGAIPDVPLAYASQYIERAHTIVESNGPIPGMPQERVAGSLYEAAVAEMTRALIMSDRPKLPKIHTVEVFPKGGLDNLKLALLFATNLKVINAAGTKDS